MGTYHFASTYCTFAIRFCFSRDFYLYNKVRTFHLNPHPPVYTFLLEKREQKSMWQIIRDIYMYIYNLE